MPLHTLTTYLAAIPLALQALIVAAIYGAIVRWRFSWPMLLDAALLGLVLWRPSIGLAAWVGMLLAVRHVPTLAGDVVLLFKLDSFDGWTAHALLFALPALKAYTAQPSQRLPEMVSPPAPTLLSEQAMPMLLGEGLKALNSDPTAPMVGIIGATRLGKTTFTGVIVSYRQSDRLVIATPKSEVDDPWFGAVVARPVANMADLDYGPIEQAISSVHREMLRRNMPGVRDRSGITLILDEWPELAEIPGVVRKVVQMIRRGAAAGIRLIFIATDVNVRSWRMDGMAGVLDNLVFARVEDGRRWSVGRLDANWRMVAPRALDTGQVHGLAARVSLAGRGWAPAEAGLLAGLLGSVGGDVPPSAPQTDRQTQTDADRRIAMYRDWHAAGIKRAQAALIRQGQGGGLDNNEWAKAGKEIAP